MHKSRGKLFVALNVYKNDINKIKNRKIAKHFLAKKDSRQGGFSLLEIL